jgi:hypothetical protein
MERGKRHSTRDVSEAGEWQRYDFNGKVESTVDRRFYIRSKIGNRGVVIAVQYNQVPKYNTLRGDRGGYIGGGRGRGGFGWGIGLVVCQNFQQLVHYERDYPLPPTTCMYRRTTDHDIEYCPTLLGKIQEKGNQKNYNFHWIYTESRDDGRNINIVTWGGAKTGVDVAKKYPTQHQWVKKNTEPQNKFDTQKEEETFEVIKDFLKNNFSPTSIVKKNKNPPIYDIPSSMGYTSKEKPLEKVSTIKTFLQSRVKLLNHLLRYYKIY